MDLLLKDRHMHCLWCLGAEHAMSALEGLSLPRARRLHFTTLMPLPEALGHFNIVGIFKAPCLK